MALGESSQELRRASRRAPRLARVPEKSFSNEVLRMIEERAFEDWQAHKILSWAVENFHPRLALSASFGAAEGMVLLDMLHRIDPATRVFVLDTGRLHQATYDLIDRVRDRYDKPVEVVFPDPDAVQTMVREKGMNLFHESQQNRLQCCLVRKVEPMRRYCRDLDAYVSGLRREQNQARADTPKVMIDRGNGGVIKVNPLADWSSDEVWQYVRRHEVPVNRLHAEGFPSAGCEPCTRATAPGEDPRAGRWWWENDDSKECGLHTDEQEGGSGI